MANSNDKVSKMKDFRLLRIFLEHTWIRLKFIFKENIASVIDSYRLYLVVFYYFYSPIGANWNKLQLLSIIIVFIQHVNWIAPWGVSLNYMQLILFKWIEYLEIYI